MIRHAQQFVEGRIGAKYESNNRIKSDFQTRHFVLGLKAAYAKR